MKTRVFNQRISRKDFLKIMGMTGAGAILASCTKAPAPTPTSAVVAPAGSSSGPSLKGTGQVAVYDGGGAWGEAQRIAFFEPFAKETGIEVIPVPGDNEGPIRAGIEAGSPTFDVINFSGNVYYDWARLGNLLEPLDYSFWDPADKAAIGPVPAEQFGFPSMYYAILVTYDPSKYPEKQPKNWIDFWDTDNFPGPRALGVGYPGYCTYEAALLGDGVDPKNLYPLDIDRAFKALEKIKPNIMKFWSAGAEPIQLLSDGNVAMTSAWNGRINTFIEEGGKIGYSWDQSILEYDFWAVPKGAKNRENAMKFLAFAGKPEPQAAFSKAISYSPTNKRAFDFIPSERASLLPTAPQYSANQVVQDSNWWTSIDPVSGKAFQEMVVAKYEEWITQ